MPRFNIQQLNNYSHLFKRQVRVSDLNYNSHLDHSNILKIVHDARAEYFRELGFSEKNLLPKSNKLVHGIVGDLQAQYLNEGELFEELLIETDFIERSRCGFRITHRIKSLKPFGSLDQFNNKNNNNSNSNNNKPNGINYNNSNIGINKPIGENSNEQNAAGTTFKNIALIEVGNVAISTIDHQPFELPDSFFKTVGLNKNFQITKIKL
ncbi:hypothetical protein DDB_G0270262 [Dictyostelium discoideum AX4]|uniref:Thioesterase n=1 Tax=Dictyostelium discoideum TaxID=44689 RepID=Q55C23_DICDI|nr:hypothetical protein DDB_G0270262 [Dictyostelium discoideum AX4]EAL72481.1 hypothetical protein DDB_G0270262 [Dictyostelium discoideum AX4]|eukprot:XP_646658.1 hypothetical protein DDB_G0270262 [Dictyostelium discoideum AX4]